MSGCLPYRDISCHWLLSDLNFLVYLVTVHMASEEPPHSNRHIKYLLMCLLTEWPCPYIWLRLTSVCVSMSVYVWMCSSVFVCVCVSRGGIWHTSVCVHARPHTSLVHSLVCLWCITQQFAWRWDARRGIRKRNCTRRALPLPQLICCALAWLLLWVWMPYSLPEQGELTAQ